MQSFYGGRKGESLIIVKSFDSINSMNAFFNEGANTLREVGYGEHVIINTVNRSNPENGKLFRRGFEGAELVAQIVGPQGPAPETEIVDYNSLSNYDGSGSWSLANNLVSGKTNDDIKYRWMNVEDEFGNYIGMQIGFKIPYTAFDFESEKGSAYDNTMVTLLEEKPFYSKWKITIPEGIHGIDSSNIEIYETPNGKRLRYVQTDYKNKPEGEKQYIDIGEYKTISGVSLSSNGVLTVAYTYGEATPLDETIKWIKKDSKTRGIDLANDGTITVTYNTGEQDVYENALVWISKISLEENGEFKILYNNNQSYNKTLRWINKGTVTENGTLIFYYNTGEIAESYDNYFKFIKDIRIDTGNIEGEGTQKVVVSYNNSKDEVYLGKGLNYIIEAIVTTAKDISDAIEKYPNSENDLKNTKPYRLLVLYADPTKRGNVSYPSKVFNTLRADWKDLGDVRGEAEGLRIIGHFDSTDNLKLNGEWLPPEKVEGYTNERAGWGYTIGERKILYFYDYNLKKWYSIGKTSVNADDVVILDKNVNDEPSEESTLSNNGIWFVVEESNSAE